MISNSNCNCMPLFSLSISRPLVESHPAYSSTLLAFCGGPKVSGVLAEVRSNVELRKLCNCSDIIEISSSLI